MAGLAHLQTMGAEHLMANGWETVLINIVTIVPPTIMALAALKASQRVEKNIGETPDGTGSIAQVAADTHSATRLATTILDRMDERLEAVEKGQKNHEDWHAKGMPERRAAPRK